MFYLRGLLVALSEFVLLYVVCSVLVCCFWKQVQRWSRGLTAHSAANLLYALRVSPLAVPFSVVMGLSVPSFLRFEPHASSESLGAVTIVLPAIFVLFALTSGGRAWRAYARTQRSIRDWTVSATRLEAGADVDCFQSKQGAPPVALAGVGRPALVISASASALLSPSELSRTVEHELAHWRARDNLKKLLLHACAFPFMSSLEHAWLETVEYSADAEAVHNESEALDLASALVKISRIAGSGPLPELASGLVEGTTSLLEARVQRLIGWTNSSTGVVSWRHRFDLLATMSVGAAVLVLCYPSLLKIAHDVTELLVR